MLKDRDFIVFSDEWGRHAFSCKHIMKRFLPSNRILWVNTIGIRRPRLTLRDMRRSVEKAVSWLDRSNVKKEASANLTVVSPVMMPFLDISSVRHFNRRSVIRAVNRELHRRDFREPILLTTLPYGTDYIGSFGEIMDIYYCVDDFTKWPGVNQELIRSMEDELINKCDIILACTEKLCLRKERKGKKPVFLPHGVDFEHFNSIFQNIEKPEPMKTIPFPIIGFFGAIGPWLDFDLISDLAKAHRDWSLVFIGPVDADLQMLKGLKNLYLLNRVPYEELPKYAAFFDVATIPFKVNDLTVSVSPLKLLEYLACGLPVVSVNMPEIRKYENIIYIADGSKSFISSIEKALLENSEELKQRRIEKARNYSWGKVAEELSSHIERRLEDDSMKKEEF